MRRRHAGVGLGGIGGGRRPGEVAGAFAWRRTCCAEEHRGIAHGARLIQFEEQPVVLGAGRALPGDDDSPVEPRYTVDHTLVHTFGHEQVPRATGVETRFHSGAGTLSGADS